MSEQNDVNFADPVEREFARLFDEHAVRRWSLTDLAAAAEQRDDRAAA